MPVGTHSCKDLSWRNVAPSLARPVRGRRSAMALSLLAGLLMGGSSVKADEFDPLAAYEEARVLNDQWQACAASFVKQRLSSRRTAERLADQALDRCRARQDRLNRFLVGRVGKEDAGNVMALLREKYRSGLIGAITELRERD
jgi:hypothetical protein